MTRLEGESARRERTPVAVVVVDVHEVAAPILRRLRQPSRRRRGAVPAVVRRRRRSLVGRNCRPRRRSEVRRRGQRDRRRLVPALDRRRQLGRRELRQRQTRQFRAERKTSSAILTRAPADLFGDARERPTGERAGSAGGVGRQSGLGLRCGLQCGRLTRRRIRNSRLRLRARKRSGAGIRCTESARGGEAERSRDRKRTMLAVRASHFFTNMSIARYA